LCRLGVVCSKIPEVLELIRVEQGKAEERRRAEEEQARQAAAERERQLQVRSCRPGCPCTHTSVSLGLLPLAYPSHSTHLDVCMRMLPLPPPHHGQAQQASKEAAAEPWSPEELSTLAKAVVKFPAGTQVR
jgi:hypothetical protein